MDRFSQSFGNRYTINQKKLIFGRLWLGLCTCWLSVTTLWRRCALYWVRSSFNMPRSTTASTAELGFSPGFLVLDKLFSNLIRSLLLAEM